MSIRPAPPAPLCKTGNGLHGKALIAKPRIVYPGAATLKWTRPSGTGNQPQRLTGHSNPDFALSADRTPRIETLIMKVLELSVPSVGHDSPSGAPILRGPLRSRLLPRAAPQIQDCEFAGPRRHPSPPRRRLGCFRHLPHPPHRHPSSPPGRRESAALA